MSKLIKTTFLAFLLILGLCIPAFAQTPDLSTLQKGAADFSENIAKTLPFSSSLGLNWADAYIGKVFPSLPPHFGLGGSFGFTTMDLPMLKTLAGYLGYELPFDTSKMFLPAYAAEGRVGGVFLPFDVGFKFGYLPPVGLWGSGVNMNYLLIGGDIRYAVLDGKSSAVLPNISVGLGLNYLKGAVGGKVGSATIINYTDAGSATHQLGLQQPEVDLTWSTLALDFKAQISKSFLIITPYLGIGGTYAWSGAGYSVNANVSCDGAPLTPANVAEIKAYLSRFGLDDMDVDSKGISSIIENSAFSLRVFGGLSFNLMVFRLDLTGLYSFLDQNFGASFGFRFQL
jgi:hypothetical protein